jgi:hypothetical protein
MMSQNIELPDQVFTALQQAAGAAGLTPVEWIAERLNAKIAKSEPSETDVADANRRLRQHIIDFGHATGLDNDQIDADLARSYAPQELAPPRTP